MKPYRVKRGGKYIGSWLVVVDGQRVNLGTKDASEARRRAALAAKGKSWEGNEVAAEVRRAIEGAVPPEAQGPETGWELKCPDGSTVPLVEPVKPMAPESPPLAEPAPAPEPPPVPPQSAADAVNATAAGLAGEVQAALADAGIGLGELVGEQVSDADLGKVAVVGTGYVASALVYVGAGQWVEPVDLPPKLERVKALLGKLARIEVGKWNLGLEKLTPRAALLWMLGGAIVVQAALAWRALKTGGAPSSDLRAIP